MSDAREINSLPFKGRVGVGMGSMIELTLRPIPILTFSLKGKGLAPVIPAFLSG